MSARDETAEAPGRELNPHLRRGVPQACPYGECDGSGFVLEDDDTARPCRCRPERIARARSRSLSRRIPKRFEHVAFDRYPVTEMDRDVVREVRRFCDSIDKRLDSGRGLYFFGPKGTGKTTLGMLVAQQAMRARRTVAVYNTPWLLSTIRATYEQGAEQTYMELMERLASVDLLHLDDMAISAQTDWTLEQLYTIVNRRYEDERSIVLTADVESPEALGDHVGPRTCSRLLEICDEIPLFGQDHRVVAQPRSADG